MEFLHQFYSENDTNQVLVSAAQGSAFAKSIADDFNPIHNPDSKRFCVPGDLLFAIALYKYGLHQDMTFQFQDLVSADTPLIFPEVSGELQNHMQIVNSRKKPVLEIKYNGEQCSNEAQVESLLRNYVAFSGHNFPHILVPLMQQHGVMINPMRPLVIYQSMSLHFDHLNFNTLRIELAETRLEVSGKRGDTHLHFSLKSEGKVIGKGLKILVLSGLREYEQRAVDGMQEEYTKYKSGA